jgi:rod shape-determining protein MreD
MRSRSSWWILPLSLFVALLLTLLPMPPALQPLRPYWLALVLAYWVMEDPDRVGLGWAFVIGVVADLVVGTLLGEQALRLVVITFILQRFRARLRLLPRAAALLPDVAAGAGDRRAAAQRPHRRARDPADVGRTDARFAGVVLAVDRHAAVGAGLHAA